MKTIVASNVNNPIMVPPSITMQYLGGKSRIVEKIMDAVGSHFPKQNNFLDLFSGSGVVSFSAMQRGYDVSANDIQPYSYCFLSSLLSHKTDGLTCVIESLRGFQGQELFTGSRETFVKDYFSELTFFNSLEQKIFKWEDYREFCKNTDLVVGEKKEVQKLKKDAPWSLFLAYYRNTYFGVKQCAELDFLRQFSENLIGIDKTHLLACVISSMSYCVSSTTHLAQFLKPNSEKTSESLVKKRKLSLIDETIKRLEAISTSIHSKSANVFNLDFKESLNQIKLDSSFIVYADPPYFKEHYSRYYHVLDTFTLYDFPSLTYNERLDKTTVGRYREDRIISDFGKKAKVRQAFDSLIDTCMEANCKLAVSYACSSILDQEYFHSLAEKKNLRVVIKEFNLKHTGQGQARHKEVTEFLYLISK